MDFIDIIGTIIDNSIEHVVALAHLIKDLRLEKNQQDINEDIYNQIEIAKETKDKSKGYYDSYQSLIQNVPVPEIGDWAVVRNVSEGKWNVYKCIIKGYWKETDEEYSKDINLTPYVRKDGLKTIDGKSILGEGNIEVGEKYGLADQNTDGLMSKESYASLLDIKNETLPILLEHIDNILLLFNDEETPESIQAIIDRYNQIAEFIESLGETDNGQIIYNILNDIEDLKSDVEGIEDNIENIRGELTDVKDDVAGINTSINDINDKIGEVDGNIGEVLAGLGNRITQLEQNPVVPLNIIKHIFITQTQYNALESYERDTLYLIIESSVGETSHFGDTFPFILGGEIDSTKFGETFPFILD